MKRKLLLLLASVLVTLWSQAGLASCIIRTNDEYMFSGNVILNQHTAGQEIQENYTSRAVGVVCDNKGGWFELNATGARIPATVGNGVIKTNVDFVGVAITTDLLNEDTNGVTQTVLTDGSFTSRRWVIPDLSDPQANPRYYTVVDNPSYQFWAIGPEDPKSGLFGAQNIITLTTSGGEDVAGETINVYGFKSPAKAIAGCYIDTSALYFTMPAAKTTDFSQIGLVENIVQERTTSTGIDCDRDVNVQFTLTPTGSAVPGFPDVLAPETGEGNAEGVGATFKYYFIAASGGGGRSAVYDLKLGEPFYLNDGPVGNVKRTYIYLQAYYYRFGDEVKAGHFRSTATLNVQIQ